MNDRDLVVLNRTALTSLIAGESLQTLAFSSVSAAAYVPQLAGTEYGKTTIRDLLHMASGVAFNERYDGNDDISRLIADIFGPSKTRAASAVAQFNTRVAPPGTRWNYASIETLVLGLVLREAIRRPITDYLREKIWQPSLSVRKLMHRGPSTAGDRR